MSAGFGGGGDDRTGKDAKIEIDIDAVAKLTKKYKKIKKYMKSNYYDLLQMHGTEKIVTNLLKEPEEDG
jgi:hypothetical protein|tara:strand:- start:1943 stop:2149 length:207 start_codon:yes stop_codon:yes gene_type:complete